MRPKPVWNGLETILTPRMRAKLPSKLSESLKENHHGSNQHVYLPRTLIFYDFVLVLGSKCYDFEMVFDTMQASLRTWSDVTKTP